ncbi:MAG TPA: sigma-70 family RNA polymerase sigma factor, partial [Anaerolineales bacterium]|nr:sigma-70 family RNA polymerase sigma factor [Anaerolineales bacterium]
LKRFDTSKPLRPWLMRITSNLARNRQRSLGRYLNAVTRFGREAGQAEEPLPRDDAQTLWKAIRQLKLEFQQVLYLRFFLDMSESEIAQAADLPAGTVKSRLHRAVAALREVIEQDYPHLKMTFNA